MHMVARVATVAFLGLEARAVEVQVQLAPGVPAFIIVEPRNRRNVGVRLGRRRAYGVHQIPSTLSARISAKALPEP